MKWFDRVTVLKKLLLAFAVVIGFGAVDSGAALAGRVSADNGRSHTRGAAHDGHHG